MASPAARDAFIRDLSARFGEPAWTLAARLDGAERVREVSPSLGNAVTREDVFEDAAHSLARLGVTLANAQEVLREPPDWLQSHWMRRAPGGEEDALVALQRAYWTGGVVIRVPAGVRVDAPIEIPRFTGTHVLEYVLVIAEARSRVHIVDACPAPRPDIVMHAGRVDVHVADGARVQYSSIENWGARALNAPTRNAWVDARAHMHWVAADVGARESRVAPTTLLQGEGASVAHGLFGLATLAHAQRMAPRVIHAASSTTSETACSVIAGAGAEATQAPVIEVGRVARDARVEIACHALLLDESARVTRDVHVSDATRSAAVHERSGAIGIADDEAFLASRVAHDEWTSTLVAISRFVEPVMRAFPAVYAVEVPRLVEFALSK